MRGIALDVSLVAAWALMTIAVFRPEFVSSFGDGWLQARIFVLAVDVAVAVTGVAILVSHLS